MEHGEVITADIIRLAQSAVLALRAEVRWKPGKDLQHLQTRIHYGHLPPSATLAAYEAIIGAVLNDAFADVYLYVWGKRLYPVVVGIHQTRRWLVMLGLDGVMETAFPPTDPDEYLADTRFRYWGRLEELTK